MTTRKIIISNEYLRLSNKINQLLDKTNIMPNIDSYDFLDIIFILTNHFSNIDDSNYKIKIDYLINLDNTNELSQEERNKIYNIIYDFIKWFKRSEERRVGKEC